MQLETDSTNATASSSPKVSRWKAIFPPAQWVPTYQARWLKDDLFAGITLAAYAIPVALAYATLAGCKSTTIGSHRRIAYIFHPRRQSLHRASGAVYVDCVQCWSCYLLI